MYNRDTRDTSQKIWSSLLTLTSKTTDILTAHLDFKFNFLYIYTFIEGIEPIGISNNCKILRDRYRLRVRASDRGEPPSYADVDVELDVVDRNNKPPIWDKSIYGPIHIRENVTVGTVVTSVKARFFCKFAFSFVPVASYLYKNSKNFCSGIGHSCFCTELLGSAAKNLESLSRETYKLEAMAQDKGYPPLSRTVEVQIDVVDRANNPPVWDNTVYGPIYVKENMPVGGKVVSIKASTYGLICFHINTQITKKCLKGWLHSFLLIICIYHYDKTVAKG
uniref:Cadherin domain-containing protein n=1 Tax=Glossina brevipalpis TaxID=37001 RepID=A0A1A9WMH4_9MUSC